MLEKRALVRLVRTPEGVFVDETGKQNGRGAYLHEKASCWTLGLKGSLEKALKVKLTDDDRARLTAYIEKNLP